jgi:hypothetical protein
MQGSDQFVKFELRDLTTFGAAAPFKEWFVMNPRTGTSRTVDYDMIRKYFGVECRPGMEYTVVLPRTHSILGMRDQLIYTQLTFRDEEILFARISLDNAHPGICISEFILDWDLDTDTPR